MRWARYDPRQRHLVGEADPDVGADQRVDAHVRRPRLRRVGRDGSEVTVDHREGRIGLEVPGDRQHRVVRRVPGREEVSNVVERGGGEVLHRADRRVVVGVPLRIDEGLDALVPVPVRLVVDAPAALVLHDVALVVELLQGHRRQQARHAIGLEPQRHLELVAGERVEVVRPIQPGAGVEGAAGRLDEAEVLPLLHVRRALEHHVLEQVREAGLAGLLVLAADVVPEVHRDHRRARVARQDDAQPVVEGVALDRDLRQGKPPDGPMRTGQETGNGPDLRARRGACGVVSARGFEPRT